MLKIGAFVNETKHLVEIPVIYSERVRILL